MYRVALLKQVQRILTIRGLQPDADVREILKHQRRFFRTRCVNAKGERFTFKVYLLNFTRTRRDFQNEIAFYHYAAKAHLMHFPRFVAGQMNAKHPWIIYHYIPGTLFTDYLRRRALPTPLLANLTHTLFSYSRLALPAHVVRSLHLSAPKKTHFSDRFRAYVHGSHTKVIAQYLTVKELEACARLIALQQTDSARPPFALSHGDLSTNNLLVDHGFAVLDWEHVQYASPAYDIAEIWVKEFSKARWRNQLATSMAKMHADTDAFQQLFRIEVLLFCLRDIILHDRILHELHHEARRRIVRRILRYYVSTFRAALRGFPTLLYS
jgi:hypothetical protein